MKSYRLTSMLMSQGGTLLLLAELLWRLKCVYVWGGVGLGLGESNDFKQLIALSRSILQLILIR